MTRLARVVLPGVVHHITQHGVRSMNIFYRDKDRKEYLFLMNQQAERCGLHFIGYCLMTNHVHLLLTPMHENSASLMMKHLGQRYVQYINRTYKRSGTLWEGRFRSCLTQSEEYVSSCYRFNGQGEKSELITPHEQYHRCEHNVFL